MTRELDLKRGSINEDERTALLQHQPQQRELINVRMDPEKAIEKATEFGRYQFFLLVTLLWGNVIDTGNIVYMVFGAADATQCLSSYNQTIRNGSSVSFEMNCTEMEYVFKSMIPEYALEGNNYITALLTSVQLSGALFGALLGGVLSDKFGRRYNTWFWLTMEVSLGSLSALANNWNEMMAFRFFIGFATGGYDSSVIILLMEWANAKTRLLMQNALMCINSVGFMWLALMAFLTKDLGWKYLAFVANLQGIPCIIAFFFIMETPRWLLLQGKTEEAAKVLQRVAKWNNLPIDVTLDDYAKEAAKEQKQQEAIQSSYLDFFKDRKLIQHILMVAYSFLVTGIVGYVFVFNIGNLVGSIFLNFAILGGVNVIAAIILSLIDKFHPIGRRMLHQVCLNGVTIFILIMIVIYLTVSDATLTAYPAILVTPAMIGSMFSFPLWTVSGLYSGELFPTQMRNKSSGVGTMTSILGGILSPIILTLFVRGQPSTYSQPFIIVVAVTVINTVLAWFFLPETRGVLTEKETTTEAENTSAEDEAPDKPEEP